MRNQQLPRCRRIDIGNIYFLLLLFHDNLQKYCNIIFRSMIGDPEIPAFISKPSYCFTALLNRKLKLSH